MKKNTFFGATCDTVICLSFPRKFLRTFPIGSPFGVKNYEKLAETSGNRTLWGIVLLSTKHVCMASWSANSVVFPRTQIFLHKTELSAGLALEAPGFEVVAEDDGGVGCFTCAGSTLSKYCQVFWTSREVTIANFLSKSSTEATEFVTITKWTYGG